MTRKVDVFTAGCEVCERAVALVDEMACPDCDVAVHDLRAAGANRVIDYGVVLPAVTALGRASACATHRQPLASRQGTVRPRSAASASSASPMLRRAR